MAEVLLKDELRRRDCADVHVVSSGTWGIDGSPPTPEAVLAVGELDIDLSGHRARSLDVDEVRTADLVVAMTSVHVREILDVAPEAEGKLVMLKEIPEIRMEPGGAVPESPEARLGLLLEGDRPEGRRSLDVDDPIGLPSGAYDRCVSDLELGIDALVAIICGDPQR